MGTYFLLPVSNCNQILKNRYSRVIFSSVSKFSFICNESLCQSSSSIKPLQYVGLKPAAKKKCQYCLPCLMQTLGFLPCLSSLELLSLFDIGCKTRDIHTARSYFIYVNIPRLHFVLRWFFTQTILYTIQQLQFHLLLNEQ